MNKLTVSILLISSSLLLTACGKDYDFKTKAETKDMTSEEVAVLACQATGELDFKQLKELTFESYHRRLNKYEDGKKSTEEWEKSVENIDCTILSKKEYKNNKDTLFKFKNFKDITIYDKDDFKIAAL